jgi:CheY-like chemotaxis protein/nitrogen-specific signal transduction histidine kinase
MVGHTYKKLAQVSHDMRTPIHAILGVSELLCGSALNSEQLEYIGAIQASGETLLRLINDIIDTAQLDANLVRLKIEQFDVEQFIEAALSSYRILAKSKGLEFIATIELPDNMIFQGDRGRILQILENLLGNALKFTKEGHVALRCFALTKYKLLERLYALQDMAVSSIADDLINAVLQNDEQRFILFEVSDSGIGISKSHMSSIFEAFQQGDEDIKLIFGGNGLGLNIAHQLATLMGGGIFVHSEKDQGSCFCFYLPLSAAQEISTPQNKIEDEQAPSLKVLVIEDHDMTAELMVSYFERKGHNVTLLQNGFKAYVDIMDAVIAQEGYDLCLVDYKIDGMDGLSLIKKVMANISAPMKVPSFILLSGQMDASMEARVFEDHSIKYIQKPAVPKRVYQEAMNFHRVRCDEHNAAMPEAQKNIEDQKEQIPPLNVLIADDVPMNILLLQKMLEKMGHKVVSVDNGLKTVKAVEEKMKDNCGYDLILLDCQMPIMNGFETAKRIKSMGVETAILGVTADVQEQTLKQALKAGMDDVLYKPFNQSDIEAFIRKQKAS